MPEYSGIYLVENCVAERKRGKIMNLLYKSTRNSEKTVTASEAILKGLADDGGLFVPESIPKLDVTLDELKGMSYQETAYAVMKQFFTDFTEEELKHCINSAYDSKFDTEVIAPLVKVGDTYHLELFHGATIAFKDMALSILPHLLITSAKKNNVKNEIVILTATSGDTGKAALAGFADVPGTRIIVFYPKGGVSRIQELQMVTQKGENTSVVAIHGNFDHAQSGVKAIFEDKKLAEELADAGYQFSSANSINIGRLVPQVVYYVYAYAKLLENEEIKAGEKINVTVPTGNFGNILAAYYAKQMGVPIAKLICASNENKVLFDFFKTGVYDITEEMRGQLGDFVGGFATEEETKETIKNTYEKTGYVMDTHTAVAAHVCAQYRKESGDEKKCLVASTASPYKFIHSVMTAIDDKYAKKDEFELIDELSALSATEIPNAIKEIRNAQIRHNRECDSDKMKEIVKEILNV